MPVPITYRPGVATSTSFTTAGVQNIAPASPIRVSVSMYNAAGVTMYIGPTAGVTTSTGYGVPTGTSFTDSVTVGDWFAIPGGAALDVRVLTVTSL